MGRYARLARFMVTVLFVAGFAAPGVASPPVAAAATTPCHAGSDVLLSELLSLAGDNAGPLVGKYETDPMLMSDSALACYGHRTLHFTAWVRDPGVVGWEYVFGLAPGWFRSAEGLFVSVAAEPPPGVTPLVALAVPPALGDLQGRHVGHWVVVTGHFDDPAAATCAATGEPGVAPNRSQAMAICQSIFVVSGVSLLGAPATTTEGPPVAPIPVAAATTPCHAGGDVLLSELLSLAGDNAGPLVGKYDTDPMLMSDSALECYGHRTLRFTAYVRDPGEVGWTYTYGLDPGWFRTAGSLFVATTSDIQPGRGPFTALAVPPGLGELQAKHVGHWVVVTGHFDDPAAATCTATGEPGVAPSAADAVAICRSTFVVASIARTEAPATSMADAPIAPTSWGGSWLAVSAAFGGVAALWFTGRRRRR